MYDIASPSQRKKSTVSSYNIPFVSDIECPALMFYEVEGMTYTTNALDSVKLVNARITYEEAINFHIYYRATGAE